MKHFRWFGVLALGLAVVCQNEAASKKKTQSSTGAEKSNTGALVSSAEAEKNAAKLVEKLNWHTSLAEAQSQARRENKPILWLHVLGKIDGVC